MEKFLMELASSLARDPLSVDELLAELGTASIDYGANVTLIPFDSRFKGANIVRRVDHQSFKPTQIPAHVELTLVHGLPFETLAEAFGAHTLIPEEEESPARAIFYLDLPGRSCRVALIAELSGDQVTAITLRRDIPK